MYMTFGKYIENLRIERGLSQRKFATMVGITATYMSKIERGEFKAPSEEVIKRMAKLLSKDSDVMLAKAGKIDSELIAIILSDPVYYCALIRSSCKK
jgi:HTH-type transcriptional regulator, competence development regulator